MDIEPKTLREFRYAEIAAACLWEMTFYGYEQDKIQKLLEDIMDDYEDAVG
jgi:hypothetical protein